MYLAGGTAEEQPVSIRREIRCEFIAGAIDVSPEVLGRSPRVVKAVALGNPNIVDTKTPWTGRTNVETESIVRDSGVKVVDIGVYDRAEVDWLGPI